jgi:hypothetical protein
MKVFVLQYCRTDIDLFGNCLFQDSVRNSFPDDEIIVYDNFNPIKYCSIFKEKADKIGAEFKMLKREYGHTEYILQLITQEIEPFYLIDPDTIWFEPLPQHFDAAIVGRYVPPFYNPDKQAYTLPRIHPSCMYIDPIKCKNIIKESVFGDDLICQIPVFTWNKTNYWIDSVGLFYTFYKDQCQVFSDDDNAKFAHLLCGTHISLVQKRIPELSELHQKVQFNLISPRQLHSIQNDLYEKSKWPNDILMPDFSDLNVLNILKNCLLQGDSRRLFYGYII